MKLDGNKGIEFNVADGIKQLDIKGAYFVAQLDQGRANHDAIAQLLKGTTQHIRASQINTKDDAVLTGFRDLHTAVGVSNRKHISSPENLIELISKGRDLPSINPVVDIYNIVSLETRLALGAHDAAKLDGSVSLRLTDGSEQFTPLGSAEKKPIGAGEYAYVDEGCNEVICRLETRQCEKTKVVATTQECFFIVEGNRNTELSYVEDAVVRLQSLLEQYCGASKVKTVFWLGE